MQFDWTHEHECDVCGATVACAEVSCMTDWAWAYTAASLRKYHETENEAALRLRAWRCEQHRLRRVGGGPGASRAR